MSLATIPEYRLTFKTGAHVPPLHPVLTSVRRRFLEETGEFLISSKLQVFQQTQANFEAASNPADPDDKNSRTQKAHVLFRTGLANCLESFVSSGRDYYNKVVKIACANPEWGIPDPPAWARHRIQELLDEKLFLPGVSDLAAVERWFRWACEGLPDFDRGEHGFSEPWCGPVWCALHFSISTWTRNGCPDRLTAERTQKEINRARFDFTERLKNELLVAEDEARIELEGNKMQSIVPRPASQGTSASRAPSRARLPVRSSGPLSTFEETVGKLMAQARRECPTKCLPQTEILKIATVLDDDKSFSLRDNLERAASHEMAEHNKHYSKAAIKTWTSALRNPKFRRAVRKRFSRAEEKYKKTTSFVGALSAGTSRTTV